MGEKRRADSRTSHWLVDKVLASRPAVAELIGFSVEEISGGRAVGCLEAGPQHANPMGTTHGGVLCDLADAAMGMAFASTLAPGESFTTMSLSINFFRPVWQARLRAEAHVVRRGQNVGYIECEVADQDGKQVAKQTLPVSFYPASTQNSRGQEGAGGKDGDLTRDDSIMCSERYTAQVTGCFPGRRHERK